MRTLSLSSRLDAVSAKAETLKLPIETRLALEAAAEIVAEKITKTQQHKIEKAEKKHARKTKIWVEVTSQPTKHKKSFLGRASFYWKGDPDKNKHSVNITLHGPGKLSIHGKDLHVVPKGGEPFNWGEEHEAQEGKSKPTGEKHVDKDEGKTEEKAKPEVTKLDPHADENGDGVTDAARVGVPANSLAPPPKLPGLNGLTDDQKKVQDDWNAAIEGDPSVLAKQYMDTVLEKAKAKGGPPTFVTDDVKFMHPTYRGKQGDPETQAWRAKNNVLLHQGANAVAKQAFVKQLDELAKLPDGDPKKSVLVTSGGCGAGKGFALKSGPDNLKALTANTGAVWDAAGEQNATENPWILEECKKRGIKPTFLFVDADPKRQWAHKKLGVVQRAADPQGEGRMVDARLFADSYALGGKNFKAFHDKNKDNADFVFINTWDNDDKGFPIIKASEGLDDRAAKLNSDDLYSFATDTIQKDAPTEAIKEGATVGQKIWGPPPEKKAEEKTTASAKLSVLDIVMRTQGSKTMAAKKSKLHELLTKNFEENMANLDDFLAKEDEDVAETVKTFEQKGLVYDKDGKLVLPK